MRIHKLLFIVPCFVLTACGPDTSQPSSAEQLPATQSDQCGELSRADIAGVTITKAGIVAAGTFTAPTANRFGVTPDYSGLPDFCRVAGSIAPAEDSDIRFELWLPVDDWNGRFLQTGNGGAAGAIVYRSLVAPLLRGYAVANTDTGHEGGAGEFTWAPDHPDKLIDYQYRAVRELTLAGKALTAAYYGRPPEKAFWLGCSTGGRQGLKEVQRYPADYDAVVAGAPANNWSPLMSLSIIIERNLGPQGLHLENLGLLRDAAVAACDGLDGVSDGVIADPASCTFDAATLACDGDVESGCLTPQEVAAAGRIYAGVVNAAGDVIMPGTGPGSEEAWAGYASERFRIGSSYFRNLIASDASWDPAAFDVDRDLARAEAFDRDAAKAMDPNIGGFVDRGGKLLLYHGTTDGLIPYGNSVRYYQSVVDTLGAAKAADSVRLFLVPGMNHCAGGAGAHQVDWLTAMENWVEDGIAPESLTAVHPGEAAFTRPLCAYPQRAAYKGDGDPTQAASFECRSTSP